MPFNHTHQALLRSTMSKNNTVIERLAAHTQFILNGIAKNGNDPEVYAQEIHGRRQWKHNVLLHEQAGGWMTHGKKRRKDADTSNGWAHGSFVHIPYNQQEMNIHGIDLFELLETHLEDQDNITQTV